MPSLFQSQGAVAFEPTKALRALRKADPVLAELISRVGPFRLTPATRFTPFEALCTSIVYQQLNGRAAATILGRFRALFPGRRFPRPEDVLKAPPRRLAKAGLSRPKLLAMRDLAQRALAGQVPSSRALRAMPDEDIIERLTLVRGVGRWTAQMLLIFRLGRPDVLPALDYGVRQGFTRTYRLRALVEPDRLLRHGERWRPYRTVASWYLWRSLELGPR